MPASTTESPLSITASIAGILTFLAAIAATLYVRFTYLRNASSEYFQVKASLSWYKTESTFMHELLRTTYNPINGGYEGSVSGNEREKEMYTFVVEDLARLEARLLEVVEEAEMKANSGNGGGREGGDGREGSGEKGGKEGKEKGWTIIPRGKTGIAMSWLPVRAKALELVRQRDGLGSRVLFAQMSMISSRVKDQEARSEKREERQRERMDKLERLVYAQHEKLDRLEDLMYRVMHQDRVIFDKESESPRYEEEYPAGHPVDATVPSLENAEPATYSTEPPRTAAQLYPIQST